ncbi:MAG: hypothetical protein J07HR59_01689 [Halorubrum sp. J07HR59]|nr:MAG: hypothetical protein J07HR59_01689 [Halorubrum sp. J07HR59]
MPDDRNESPSTVAGSSDNQPAAGSESGTTARSSSVSGESGGASEPTGVHESPSGREVVVPLSVYKVITVFSTLAAIVTFFLGFLLLDAATLQASILRELIALALGIIGIAFADPTLTALLSIGGLTSIVTGAAVYVLGTRFRAQGMGKPQDDAPGSDIDG